MTKRRKISAMERDTWSLDVALAKWLLPRLRILKRTKHGIPIECFPTGKRYLKACGNPTKEADRVAALTWDNAIGSMIVAMESASGDWLEYGRTYRQRVQPGLDALAKYFGNLWD